MQVFGKRKQFEQHMIAHYPSKWKRCEHCNFVSCETILRSGKYFVIIYNFTLDRSSLFLHKKSRG